MSKSKPAIRNGSKSAPTKTTRKNTMQPWMIVAGLAALIALAAGAFLLRGNGAPASGAPAAAGGTLPGEISVQQAHELYPTGAFFLDVRTPEEWNEYHAPDTTLIPLDQLAQRTHEVPKDRPVVVVCRSGNRSQQGRDILRSAGFTNVASMAGGLKTWRDAGYPTVTGP